MLEWMQMAFFPLRSFEWMDWLFDALGVLVGFFTFTKKPIITFIDSSIT